jgi:glycosyltransferase involved in cell wall biosynthesis
MMDIISAMDLDLVSAEYRTWNGGRIASAEREHRNGFARPFNPRDMEFLRRCAWEIGERKPAESFTPASSHVGLAAVSPGEGFAHWRIPHEWVDQTAWRKGNAFHHCRLIIRLYDVSYIHFNGFNAHSMQDHDLPSLCGHLFFKLPRPGTWRLAEVGFLLRDGEFIPAARSQVVAFARDAASPRGEHTALLVDDRGRVEEIGNLWEQEKILYERRRPKVRKPLRIAALAFESLATGQDSTLARFVSELASGQSAQGHEVHVFVPACDRLTTDQQMEGVFYHPVEINRDGTPLDQASAFAQVAAPHLQEIPPCDLVHLHEWMAGLAAPGTCPTVLSLSSLEVTRRNGTPPSPLSLAIQQAEQKLRQAAGCILTPDWLREKAVAELDLDRSCVHAFPMEGRLANEWECPLDYGQVKKEIGVGPLDRLLLFVGPLEYAAGVDLLLEALPVLLQRCPNLRVAFAGAGNMHGSLEHRAHQLGVAYAVRLLGHVDGPRVTRLLRAAEALVLPSRYRIPFDDAVVDLARRAGRPVVTTHGGPAHLVRHEETGIVTYDNPGSMVWAVDRILGDPAHAERMGDRGRRSESTAPRWSEVAGHYLELCATCFPELTETWG